MILLVVFILIALASGLIFYSRPTTTSKSCQENSNANYTFDSKATLGSELLKMFIGTIKSFHHYVRKLV